MLGIYLFILKEILILGSLVHHPVLSSADRKIECYLLSEGPCPEEAFDETSELRRKGDVEVIQSMERFRSRSTI